VTVGDIAPAGWVDLGDVPVVSRSSSPSCWACNRSLATWEVCITLFRCEAFLLPYAAWTKAAIRQTFKPRARRKTVYLTAGSPRTRTLLHASGVSTVTSFFNSSTPTVTILEFLSLLHETTGPSLHPLSNILQSQHLGILLLCRYWALCTHSTGSANRGIESHVKPRGRYFAGDRYLSLRASYYSPLLIQLEVLQVSRLASIP